MRATRRPDPTAEAITPTISGTSSSPEFVALAPLTTCRNSGKNTIAPNMLTPITSDIAAQTANTRLLNSPSGRIGSAARRS